MIDPKVKEIADRLQPLIGQRLIKIRVEPIGVIFEFERNVYFAYGPIGDTKWGPNHPSYDEMGQ
jgi:hypothetical protein